MGQVQHLVALGEQRGPPWGLQGRGWARAGEKGAGGECVPSPLSGTRTPKSLYWQVWMSCSNQGRMRPARLCSPGRSPRFHRPCLSCGSGRSPLHPRAPFESGKSSFAVRSGRPAGCFEERAEGADARARGAAWGVPGVPRG